MVLFGSQTGTAEDFGDQLVKEMEAFGVIGDLKDMEDVDGDQLSAQKYVIFVVATYGEGEPTDNAKEMWEYLTKECNEDEQPLKQLKYGVFGLGNKTYENYNWMGRQLNKRLAELGGSLMIPYGEGDDDATLEDDFSEWKKSIWGPLCDTLGVKQDVSLFESGALGGKTWKWQVNWVDQVGSDPVRGRFTGKVDQKKRVYDKDHPFFAKVEGFRELNAPDCDRGCIHADVILPKGARYEEGDHLGVYPLNAPALVDAYCKYFNIDASRLCVLVGNTDKDRGQTLFGPAPVGRVFAEMVDLQEVPRKSVLEKLLSYATSPVQNSALKHFLDKPVYTDKVEKNYMTVLEILMQLPERLVVPVEELIQILPPLQPRYYSISSSLRFRAPAYVASITCARVNVQSPTGRAHNGVASNWLYGLWNGSMPQPVPAFLRTSTFRLPSGRPAIMIGPGTGIAPFMGFLQRRVAENARMGDIMFTGFRTRKEYLYGEQLEQWARDGYVELHVAFSREGAQKHYVQHDLEKHADKVWDLIEQRKANLYICGDANHMEKDVIATLIRIIKAKKGVDDKNAQAVVDKMTSSKQLQKDVWF